MDGSLPRRRILIAAAVPGVLAGCFEEPAERDEASDEAADLPAGDGGSGSEDGESGSEDGGDADDHEESGEPTEPPDRVDPEAAGVVVTDVTITNVNHGNTAATVFAEIVLENVGRFEYGFLELRVDAYTTTPNSQERTRVGFEYPSWLFPEDDRFSDGTRRVSVSIRFHRRDAARGASSEWYEVDAAVRRAEPSATTE